MDFPPNPADSVAASAGKSSNSVGKQCSSKGNLQEGAGFPAENALKGEVRERERNNKDAAPLFGDAALPVQPHPKSQCASVITTPEADLYRIGKDLLGSSAGGLVKRLIKAQGGNIALARPAIETASTKGNAREYIGAIIGRSNGGRSDHDLGGVRSSRDM